MDFALSKNKKASKNIFVSSTIDGEGKTSMSINLAKILALSSKKVLLIEGDIRKPSIAKILKVKNKEGLTNYFTDDTLKPEALIESLSLNLDFLQSGAIPPNPSELIMNSRIDELFDYTYKNYDYFIIDSTPVGMVTDTILFSQNRTDLFLYIVRAYYLDKRMLKIPKKIHETKQLDNMAIVLNSSNPNLAYGYNQIYGLVKKPWWKRFFT
ncbi:CpsD/CapB family tyrosine-protein kinase [bacterium]|nr:CpsD/CapB family tyrosine-protein kinase [bacterium]